jgi:quinoprotein glucose dehydrogenase
VTLLTSDGETVKVAKSDIEERQRGPSAMPADMTKHLTKSELRDIVEFLSTLKAPTK